MVISLKKFWSTENPSGIRDDDPLRVIRLLLQGIAMHAVEGDRTEHDKFRQDMERLLKAVESNPSNALLLLNTGSALTTLESYNRSTTRYIRMQGTELQNMILMLTKTVATLGSGSDRSVSRLQEIETQLQKASEIEDVRMLKLRMEQCLESIREETTKQKADSSRLVEDLQQDILQTQERMKKVAVAPLDAMTGLPLRPEAERAFAEAASSPKPAYAVMLAVDRVSLINGRFGYAAGDQVLKLYLESLRPRLLSTDRIFRWSGPAFVVLAQRPDRLETVRDQFRSVVPAKTEKTISFSSRTALVALSATWTVFSINPPVEDLIHQIDAFLSSQLPHPA